MSKTTKTALVTGGAGFIGSHLVDRLVSTGRRVIVLDDLSSGRPENLEHHAAAVELRVGSVTDRSACVEAIRDVEEVFHLASRVSVVESVENPDLYREVLVGGTANVLKIASKASARRVVLASSCSVYGDADPPVSETASTDPQSPYAAFKLASEEACRRASISTVCPRFFNVYGPRQRHDSPYNGVIAIFSELARRGERPRIFGDGLQTRDFIHVSDITMGLLYCMESQRLGSGEAINLGTGSATTITELARLLGCGEPIHEPAREGEIRHSRANIDRATAVLGFSPLVQIADGLRSITNQE